MKIILALAFIILMSTEKVMALELLSTAFRQGDSIPSRYTCDGDNVSPPLNWKDAPSNTRSFVLIMEDPDAPNGFWDHWILYNLPAVTNSLLENNTTLPEGTVIGKNSWNNSNYGGPCPPNGEHRYLFKLYALDILLPQSAGMTKQDVAKAMNGHILAIAELVAKYQRSK